ncbi:MAG TPA: protein kinase [Sphingobacteriaceae bacterium]
MPKEIRITRGLESMGALRPEGSGSVLKGKRKGDLLTAIKVFPVTIHARGQAYDQFRAGAEQLKRINLEPNPNVVKVLDYGISEIGSQPFIETGFIDGPDLDELLEPPYDPVFTIFEVLKIADHLASALAQCHQAGVVHGNIKPANIRFNLESADYVLVGVGLSALTPKQRQAIRPEETPYSAPEIRNGRMTFSSDIYSYGMILYRLLTGTTPFHRPDEAGSAPGGPVPLPGLLDTRRENLPDSWSPEQKAKEMEVPAWLPGIIATCLRSDPDERYFSGVNLQEALVTESMSGKAGDAIPAVMLQQENDRLRSLIIHNKELAADKEQEVARLKALVSHREEQLNALKYQMGTILPEQSGVSLGKVITAVLLVGMLAAAGSYIYLNQRQDSELAVYSDPVPASEEASDSNLLDNVLPAATEARGTDSVPGAEKEPVSRPEPASPDEADERGRTDAGQPDVPSAQAEKAKPKPARGQISGRRDEAARRNRPVPERQREETVYEPEPEPYRPKYTLDSSQAFFYSRPEETARRNLVLVPSDNTELVAVEDSNGFIYVSFFDSEGKTVRGWLRKQDLRRLN